MGKFRTTASSPRRLQAVLLQDPSDLRDCPRVPHVLAVADRVVVAVRAFIGKADLNDAVDFVVHDAHVVLVDVEVPELGPCSADLVQP